jgi:hypothetical protein
MTLSRCLRPGNTCGERAILISAFCVQGIGGSLMQAVRRHTKVVAHAGAVVVLALCAPLSWAQGAVGSQLCSGAIGEALLAALHHGVANLPVDYTAELLDPKSPAIPDYNVLRRDGPILVRN